MMSGQQVAALSDEITFDVSTCRCCGQPHTGIIGRPFKRGGGPFTHYYICPAADGEPVNMALYFSGEDSSIRKELHRKAVADIYNCQAQPVIFATAFIEKNGAVTCNVHVENGFPSDRFAKAAEQFHAALLKIMPPQPPTEPLRTASPEIFKTTVPKPTLNVETTELRPDDQDETPDSEEENKG